MPRGRLYSAMKAAGIRSGFGDDMLSVGAVKYGADGSASERTMAMSTPYAGRPDAFSRMLEAMIIADGSGHYDHLLDYSRAVTGAAFFVPPIDWLTAQA